MKLALPMKFRLILLLGFLFLQHNTFSQNRTLRIRFQNTVDMALRTEGVSIEKKQFDRLPPSVESKLGSDEIYELKVDQKLKAYAYLGAAPSKERDFDFTILFTPELEIKKVKVLIYRESFGREIETDRWLRQFEGMTPESSVKFEKDIDGITGATISARSMTRAVEKALQIINALNQANLL